MREPRDGERRTEDEGGVMGLYEFRSGGECPRFPVRKKEDVLQIVKRWEDGPFGNPADGVFIDDGEVDWGRLEQDIHALAAIAMEALPD